MGCSCGRNTVQDNPESIVKEGSFEDVIKRLSEILQKYVLADKTNSNYTNHSIVESQVGPDKVIVNSFDLNEDSQRTIFISKINEIKRIKDQIKPLLHDLDLVYDFDSPTKKVFLIIRFERFFYDSKQSLYDAIQNTKSVSLLETGDLVPYDNFLTALSKNTSLKKIIFGTFYEDQLNKIMISLKNHPNVERFTLIDLKLKDDSIEEIFDTFLKENKTLKSINLKNNKIDLKGKGLQDLKDLIVKSSIPLERLNLMKNDLKEDKVVENLGQIIKSKKLTKLNIVNCKIKSLETFNNLFNNYISSTSITILELSFNAVNVDLLTAFINKNNTLKNLVLQKIKVDPSSKFDEFGAAFIGSSVLESVSLSYDLLTGASNDNSKIAELFKGFAQKNPSIPKKLKIFKSEFSKDSGEKLANSFNDKVADLDFSNCVFKDTSFKILMDKLSNATVLKKLTLNFIEIGDGENLSFTNFIDKNNSLTSIQYSNPLSTEEITALGEAIVNSPNLKSVTLQNCLKDETLPGEFFSKLRKSKIEELDFTTCDCNDTNYGDDIGAFINSSSSLKSIKIGGKSDNFKIKHNNKIFAVTNKSNLESFGIYNIKFDPSSIRDFLKQTPNLKEIIINGSATNSSVFKYLEESNLKFNHIEVMDLPIDQSDCQAICNLIKNLKVFKIKPKKISGLGLKQIFEGLKNNSNIEKFEIDSEFTEYQYASSFYTYYQNLVTCPKLSNIIVSVQSINGDVEYARSEAIESSKSAFGEFDKIIKNPDTPAPPNYVFKHTESQVAKINASSADAVQVPINPK